MVQKRQKNADKNFVVDEECAKVAFGKKQKKLAQH